MRLFGGLRGLRGQTLANLGTLEKPLGDHMSVHGRKVRYLCVAAGGSGMGGNGTQQGGSGGAGGLRRGHFFALPGDSRSITVGAATAGANGGNSSIAGIVSCTGGGRGGSAGSNGQDGGSGGGGGGTGGSGTSGGAGIDGEGYAGGGVTGNSGAGGGGAGRAANALTRGPGLTDDINGTSTEYARGGQSGQNPANYGDGGRPSFAVGDNLAGLGGVVIVRYRGAPRASGGTVTRVGRDTVHTFTSSGTLTFY